MKPATPIDYYSIPTGESSTPNSGCRDLLLAILEDVFRVKRLTAEGAFCARGLRKQLQIDEAWLRSEDDSPFSFVWCCAHLQISPQKIRRAYFDHEEPEKIAA